MLEFFQHHPRIANTASLLAHEFLHACQVEVDQLRATVSAPGGTGLTESAHNNHPVEAEAEASPPTDLGTSAKIFQSLPRDLQIKSDHFSTLASLMSGKSVDSKIALLLDGVHVVDKHGNHVELRRTAETAIPLDKKILGGALCVNSVKLDNISFDYSANGDSQQLKNLQGVEVNVSAFGLSRDARVQELDFCKGVDGKPAVVAHVEDPLPRPLQVALGLPSNIPVSVPVSFR